MRFFRRRAETWVECREDEARELPIWSWQIGQIRPGYGMTIRLSAIGTPGVSIDRWGVHAGRFWTRYWRRER